MEKLALTEFFLFFLFSDFVSLWSPQLSFQEWTQPVQEMLNTKKLGDVAFRDKDFENAIECYSKVILKNKQTTTKSLLNCF